MIATAHRYLAEAADGEDVAQDVMIHLWEKKDHFNNEAALLVSVRDAFKKDKNCGYSYVHYPAAIIPPSKNNDYRTDANGHWLMGRSVVEGRIVQVTRRFSSSKISGDILSSVSAEDGIFVSGVDTAGVCGETLAELADGDDWNGISLQSLQDIGYDKSTLTKIITLRNKLVLYKKEIAETNNALKSAPLSASPPHCRH